MRESEFDQFADEYYAQHARSIEISGEDPEFFSEYKIADVSRAVAKLGLQSRHIIDFGSGIGNSIPYFRKFLPHSHITCADVSNRSMKVAQERYPGSELYIKVGKQRIPADDASFDLAFSACVFHHIDHDQHGVWLRELRRIVRSDGALFIFEHNPFNPLTVRIVNTCPFDINARLISARKLKNAALAAGWKSPAITYRVYFPRLLEALRPLEPYLSAVPLGAQYYLLARR